MHLIDIDMNDLIDEVDQDFKDEKYNSLIKKIVNIFITAAAITIIGVGLYIWKENNTKKIQAQLGQWYYNALKAEEKNQLDDAIAFYDKVIAQPHQQFASLAYLKKADILIKSGKPIDSQNCLSEMIKNKYLDKNFRDLAKLTYLGNSINYNLENKESADEILKKLSQEGKIWRISALQLSALYKIKQNKIDEAKESLNSILSSKDATRASYDIASSILATISKTE